MEQVFHKENYYALVICLADESYSIDKALKEMGIKSEFQPIKIPCREFYDEYLAKVKSEENDNIARMYFDEKLTADEIAEKYGVTASCIYKKLSKFKKDRTGTPLKTGRKKIVIDKDKYNEYKSHGMSDVKIAQMMGVSIGTITKFKREGRE